MSEQVESLRRQNQQGQAMIRTLLEQHGYPADYLELHYTCEKCQDTGFFPGKDLFLSHRTGGKAFG